MRSLNERITIQRATPNHSFGGAGSETWSDLHVCWADVRQQSGREFLTTAGTSSEVRRVFFIRWVGGILTSDRVIHDGVPHNIVEVRQIGRREAVELHTTANPLRRLGV